MLELRELCAGYSGQEVVHRVSFTARVGQITALIGPNGCGKSTLIKALCGILPVDAGQILLDGEPLLQLSRQMMAQKIAYLPQSRNTADITVGQLVLHGRFPYLSYPRRYRTADHEAARRAMEQMQILELEHRPLDRLSGGQRQKAYLAMALAQDTKVVALDEPTTYLDAAHQLQVLHQARLLARQGKCVLMVIHDLSHAMEYADHVVLMRDGQVVRQGTAEEVYASGWMESVFGVRLSRLQAQGKWRYFCDALP